MSTEYSAWLVIGCPLDELGMSMDEIEELGLDTFYPGSGEILVGIGMFATGDSSYTDLPEKYKLEETISVNFAKFLSLSGKIGKLYLTVDVV